MVPWNAPESIVVVPGVVVLDTKAVPDVIGLRARNSAAAPGNRVIIPDDRAAPWGFHDDTLMDMAGAYGPPVSKEELSALRWHGSDPSRCRRDKLNLS